VWLSVFGGTAISLNNLKSGALYEVVANNLPVALFEMINLLDIALLGNIVKVILSIIGTILVISFFVTSSDSGSLVVDNITSGGKLDSPIPQRVFWACMEGFIAAVLLIIGGEQALNALQAAVISTGLPFAIILTVMSILLIKSLQQTYTKQKRIRDVNKIKHIIETTDIEIK
jgi:choline-glycine betaine transporter